MNFEELETRLTKLFTQLAYDENASGDYLQQMEYIFEEVEKYERVINRAINYMRNIDNLSIYDIKKILKIE